MRGIYARAARTPRRAQALKYYGMAYAALRDLARSGALVGVAPQSASQRMLELGAVFSSVRQTAYPRVPNKGLVLLVSARRGLLHPFLPTQAQRRAANLRFAHMHRRAHALLRARTDIRARTTTPTYGSGCDRRVALWPTGASGVSTRHSSGLLASAAAAQLRGPTTGLECSTMAARVSASAAAAPQARLAATRVWLARHQGEPFTPFPCLPHSVQRNVS